MMSSIVTRILVVLSTCAAFSTSVVGTAQSAPLPLKVKALHVAESKHGAPYRWGAAGPRAFDCSGLVLYSFKRVGKKLPRTAQAQYNRLKHIGKKHRAIGDLVFFGGTRSIYHVGFYAGHNMIWHAPHTGAKVRKEKIWTTNVHYARP